MAKKKKTTKRKVTKRTARKVVRKAAKKKLRKKTSHPSRRITSRQRQRLARQRPQLMEMAPATATAAAVQFGGFDTGSYPGDAAINTWAAQSPYHFVGFYFDSPCHTTSAFRTWSGKFPLIKASGLGIAIIYVGFQQDGCGQANVSRAKGLEHGTDAITKFQAEGFPSGAVVFLDIEQFNGALSTAMEDYIRGWLSAVLDDGTITAGIYCHASKANEVRLAAEKEFAAHGLPSGAPVFWIIKSDPTFDPATSNPVDCGVSFASAWQGRLDFNETHGGVRLKIDQNVADSRDPSRAT